jgi:hypothetical protein
MADDGIWVLVITSPEGARERVYVGQVDGAELKAKLRTGQHKELSFLPGSRNVIWYSGASGGLDGLATKGPHTSERILGGVRTARHVLGVREVALMTPEAVEALQKWPAWIGG